MKRNWFRDNPEADAMDNAEDTRPIIGYCEVCGCAIHGSTEIYEADDGYDLEGTIICADHLKEYFEDNKIR